MGLLGLAPAGVLVPATIQTTSPLRVHRTRLMWFVSVAEAALPDPRRKSGRFHLGEGTFLSVVHCQ